MKRMRCRTEVEHLVADRAGRAVGEVVERDACTPARRGRPRPSGASARNRFIAPHSSASTWANEIHRRSSTGTMLRDRRRHQRVELAHAGVEQERLLVAHQELVEREPARGDLGDERGEPEHVGGDLVDLGVHGRGLSFVGRSAVPRSRDTSTDRGIRARRAIVGAEPPLPPTPIRRRPALRPRRRATPAAASARLRTPSLVSTRPTWCSAVFGEMNSRPPISALVKPCATSSSTSCSRAGERGRQLAGLPVAARDRCRPSAAEQRRGPIAGERRAESLEARRVLHGPRRPRRACRRPRRAASASSRRTSAELERAFAVGEVAQRQRSKRRRSRRRGRPGRPGPGRRRRPRRRGARRRRRVGASATPAPSAARPRGVDVAALQLDVDEQRQQRAGPQRRHRPSPRWPRRRTAAARSRSPRSRWTRASGAHS